MEWNTGYYQGKTAAVTGGASGVGLALCERLLECGAKAVTLVDFNRENLDRETARLSAAYPGKVHSVLCDVTDGEQVFTMVKKAADFGGDRLDLLVNCAGAGFHGKFLREPDGVDPKNPYTNKVLTQADWDKGFALNFTAPVHGCEAAVPMMIAQGGGQIVNIVSGIAFAPMAYQSVYAATKAALLAYSYAIRNELSDYGVLVTAATPGTTATAIFQASGGEAPPEAQSPRASAETILRGVSENRRLILGDASDAEGCKNCFLPDDAGYVLDEVYNGFARLRRSGVVTFQHTEPVVNRTPLFEKALAICQMTDAQLPDIRKAIGEYAAMRDPLGLDEAYYAGKTAVVTGGASGVGYALCQKLLACGAKKVVLADYNRENLAGKEAALNAAYPGRVKGIFCNVADEENVKAMIAEAAAWFGDRFDLLINCAGVGQQGLSFPVPDAAAIMEKTHMPMETVKTWERVFSINFVGALSGCRAALPIMLAQGGGQIVNIISGTAMTPMPYQAIYSSAKAALNMATLTLRYEFADDGIRINAATPGTTATAIFNGTDIPEGAQTPDISAARVLAGVARNDRLIPGDDADLSGMFAAHNPVAASMLDELMNGVVRARRTGVNTYGIENIKP